jgi:signal transduction histidine kinase
MPRWLKNSPEHIAVDLHRFVSTMLETKAVEVRLTAGRLIVDGRMHLPARDRRSGSVPRTARAITVPIGANGSLGAITIAADKAALPTRGESALLDAAANQAAVALRHLRLNEEFRRARQELSARASQQAVMTRLGLRFLDAVSPAELYAQTLRELRESLHVDYCDAFELDAAAHTLVLRAADGWPDGHVGTHRVPAEPDCEVGLALASLQPVVVVDRGQDRRFRAHALPAGILAMSGITVVVPGSPTPLGAVGVHTTDRRAFSDGEILFVQSVANLLATALRHRQAEAARDAMLGEAANARQVAERNSTLKTRFIGMMSHDLRTPLNAIGGYVELLTSSARGPLTEEQQSDIARIGRNQRYLMEMIENVLGFLTLDSARVQYAVDDFAIADLVSAVDDVIQPIATARQLRYELRLPPEPGHLRGDRRKLQQILINLLGNALKFTSPAGRVILQYVVGDATVRFHVKDSGVGIPGDQLVSLFEPFTRLRHESGEPGTGLGLSISREFALGMGGNLYACSEPGKGSTFTVVLPRR